MPFGDYELISKQFTDLSNNVDNFVYKKPKGTCVHYLLSRSTDDEPA